VLQVKPQQVPGPARLGPQASLSIDHKINVYRGRLAVGHAGQLWAPGRAAQVPFGRYRSRCRAIAQTPLRSFSAAACLASSRSAGVSKPLASRKSARSRA